MKLGGGGCSELRLCHCTVAGVTEQDSVSKKRLANWIKSQDPSVCCVQETHLMCSDTHRLKIKGWKNIYQTNEKQTKKAGVAILVSEKTPSSQPQISLS